MRPPGLRLWLVAAVLILSAFCQEDYESFQEFISTESERGLFPSIFNLATNSLATASATCGQHRKEEYCKLVEHVLLRAFSHQTTPQCDICDANDSQRRHPVEFAIDGTRRWWQSPSLAQGLENEKVTITLDLRQIYQVAYVVVKMAISPRPGTWVLEKSLDGQNWQAWQYYATSDAECMRQFGVPATTGVPRFQRDDEVICTSEYSKLTPLENGEIHTSLVNGRPGAPEPSMGLQNFTRTRYIRLRFLSPKTLNADLMIINNHGRRIDKSVTMRYFYAIMDISIGGQCICYGHAESCPSDPVTGQFKCECRHNTCGESCNKCCPLFNQLPWKPGNHDHPNVCQQCQCFNHADQCVYDEELDRNKWSITPEGVYEGGGRCVECKHNTEGFNCERCKDGYYRPSGLSHYREDACRTCDCDPVGSINTVCVKDDQTAGNGQHPGDCICKPGFGGRRCDRCARGYRNHPTCEPCPCNQAGSVNFDTCEEANCQCKANVEGLYCDRCRAGTIHLNANNPQGCQPCFCFGLSNNCTQVDWTKAVISNNHGWNITDLTGGKDVKPETENGEVLLFNANQNKDRSLYYWKAPDSFNGNMLNSYGGNLHYFVYYVPAEQGAPVPVADLVLEGNGIKLEYYSRMELFPRENMTVQIPILEGSGWYNSASRTPADKADMMRALADVHRFLVRAMYQQHQLQSSIFGLTLDTAVPSPERTGEDDDLRHLPAIDTSMRGVEVCTCPENLAGNSCESCAPGYRRVNNQLYGGRCEKCNCERHSDQCDPFTGHCLNCKHNTTGPRCELCLPGHYGNPSLGGEHGACRPCECPSLDNNRSPECVMTQLVVAGPAASQEDAYVCTACERGYEGNKCEMCADGYFGDPLAENGTCAECDCNGNIDVMSIGNCDGETGKCLKCIGNTEGPHCDICKENHWGDALQHTCKPCGCHHVGAVLQQCNNDNGDCSCKENYIGKQCDRCQEGHGDVDNGCPACECDETGSLGTACDAVSGQCSCKTGVFGKKCDQCRPSYFNFTSNGCQFCHCDTYGSEEDGKCDPLTGKCECRENVDGNMCEKCVEGYFNISSGQGCQPCDCDATGADGTACDLVSGQCVCKPGVTGLKCDKCLANHYGMDDEGCTECQPCPAPGQVCDPESGACVCPANTVGEMCENCTENAWDYHPLNGCKLCDCSSIGSLNGKCHSQTGQCESKEGYVGLKCDRCTHGFFNFPTCEPCNCHSPGTDPKQCKDGQCLCNEKGECPCKKNVEGEKCNKPKNRTFSIDPHNPQGAFNCFCFNRTDECRQAKLVWQQVYAEDRRAVFSEPWEYYTKKHNLQILKEYPPSFNSYPTDAAPLYWPLPATFLGDKLTSYNGFLRFKIHNQDNRRGIDDARPDQQYFRYFPQVILVGNNRIELEHIPVDIKDDGKYKIRLHETEWRLRQTPEVVLNRKTMMVALQNVQGVYVRGSYTYPSRGDAIQLKEISIDVGVPPSAITSENEAIGVEECLTCPQGYSGLSCQNPADEYCRKRHRDYLNQPDDLALVGWSEPCQCNGHSTKCHPETCLCSDCQHNTYGEFCEKCKSGYIGDGRDGGPSACTKCACPLEENSFSDTCAAVPYGRGYVCNACKRGYSGQYCENCIVGFFGDPQRVGGFCEECACHPDGSLHGKCDPLTGECECRPGVTGRDCSRCQERHAFIGGVCTSCDQGCYKPLMDTIDVLEENLAVQNFSNLKPIPYKRADRLANTTEVINQFVRGLGSGQDGLSSLDSKYAKDAFTVIEGARFQMDRMNKGLNSTQLFTKLLEEDIKKTQTIYAKAFNTTQFLKHFHLYGGSSVGGATLDAWVMEAEAHYNAGLERGDYIEKRRNRAEQELKKSEELLKMVLNNKLNDTTFEILHARVEEFGEWLEEFRSTMHETAKKDTADAERMSNLVGKRVDRYREVATQVEKLKAEAEDTLTGAKDSVELAKGQELLNMFDDAKAMNISLEEAGLLSEQCANLTLQYSQAIDEYDDVFAQPAAKHAEELRREAERLKDSFARTKVETKNPIKASQAYEDIVGALRNASHAAAKALAAANDAHLDADPQKESSQLAELVATKEKSIQLEVEAKSLGKEWDNENFDEQKKTLDERLAAVNEKNIAMIKRNDALRSQWAKFDDHNDRMPGLQGMARDADTKADAAKKKAVELQDQVREIEEETTKLENSTRRGIKEEIEKAREVRLGLEKATNALTKMGGMSNTNKARAEELQRQLSQLKDRINEAREKAQQIRLSVRGDDRGQCKRSFISPSHPSPVSQFNIRYRPQRNVPDSAVLVTKTQARRTQATEYIAVEIHDKRVVAHWNIGSGGKQMATNNHPINFIPSTDRSTWYHIDIDRMGDSVNLTVALKESLGGEGHRLRSDAVSVVVGQKGGDSDVVFNTVPGETTVQMGAEPAEAEEMGLATEKFHGTIGGLRVDEVPVPLWDFAHSSDECDGDTAPPQHVFRGYMFRDGFALVNMDVPERTMSAITVVFNAYSPSGLLYFRGSQESGDFMALYLEEGHVVYKVNLGDAAKAEIKSKMVYNDGREHTIKAIRNEAGIHLQVDSDADRFSATLPGQNTYLNIEHDEHMVGGVPTGFPVQKFADHDISWKGFFGCILSVKPSQVSELDLEQAKRWQRRELGCKFSQSRLEPTDRLVGFPKPGYLLTQGVQITNNSTFAFTFRTKEENGTLVFQSSKLASFRRKQRDSEQNGKGFMAYYLFRGYLVLHIGKDPQSRKDVVTIRSQNSYSDGLMHQVYMTRNGKRIVLRVDDKEIGDGTLDDESTVGTASSQMFLGGFSKRSKPSNAEIPSTAPLIGCISDIYLDYQRIPLVPEDHQAQIGVCPQSGNILIDDPFDGGDSKGAQRKDSRIVHGMDKDFYEFHPLATEKPPRQEVDRCGGGFSSAARDGQTAARYGISKSSHSRVNFVDNYPNMTEFTVSLSLRTSKDNGMVWVWANYKNYTRYIYLNIIDGYPTLEIKGHRQPKILKATQTRVNDGHWHDVLIQKRDRNLSMTIDELPPVVMVDCPAPKVMKRRMYIGGVISKHRTQFGLDTPGFDGCIRDLKVNDREQQLEGEFSRDIVPCAKASKGMYAHDGGFAVFDGLQKTLKTGSKDVDISFEWRQVTGEGTLVALLTNSKPEDARITVEVNQDKIMVTIIHSSSGLEVRDAIPGLKPFCDSQWHSMHLLIANNLMTLTIDGEKNELPLDLTPKALELFLNLPVNIAGVSAPVADKLNMTSMVGCYRELKLSGQHRYFEKAQKNNKVIVDGCPFH